LPSLRRYTRLDLHRLHVIPILLIIVFSLAALAYLAGAAMTFTLHRSDPAGNALGQVYTAITFGVVWLLVVVAANTAADSEIPPPAGVELPWTALRWAAVPLAAFALCTQYAGLGVLFDRRSRGWRRLLVHASVLLVPLAFLTHAAWRGFGLSLPTAVATWGCLAVVVAGSSFCGFVWWASERERRAGRAKPTASNLVYPGLLVQHREYVRVLRSAADLHALPVELLAPANAPVFVDANGATFTLQRVPASAGLAITKQPGIMPFAEVREVLLAIRELHADPAEDGRIRHLIPMQRDITALSFVLPH